MSLSKILAKKADASKKVETGSNNVINESSSDSEFNEIQEVLVESTSFEDENEIPPLAMRMFNLGKELAICCLIMLTYAAFTKDPPKVSKPPSAYPFFKQGSIVTDWYRGQLVEHARSSDVNFIMYYAPWDAESQAARDEFEEVAKYMKKYVTFSAINCWQPNSNCRQQYSKVYKWPVFIAYPSQGRGVQYTGPIRAVHMVRFLLKVCNPITRLKADKPIDFEDVYIVATLNTLPRHIDYFIYYMAALKYLEGDSQQRIQFYVNSTSVSQPTLIFYLWNETLTYPINDKTWSSEEIVQWLYKSIHQVSPWVLPNSVKSNLLSKFMDDQPSLVLFTPRNPLHTISDIYSMLQDIGQQYYNCDDVKLNPDSVGLELKRTANFLKHHNLILTCKLRQKSTDLVWNMENLWSNTSCLIKSLTTRCNTYSNSCLILSPNSGVVSNLVIKPNIGCAKTINTEVYKMSMLNGCSDQKSPINLMKSSQREMCKIFLLAEKYQPAIFDDTLLSKPNEIIDVQGLACKSNKSLSLLTMDSLLHYHFADKLGVDLTKYKDKTAAVIIDDKMESHYIMEQPVNAQTLRQFIMNFTNDKLSRSKKSSNMLKKKLGTLKGPGNVVVKELDSSSFLPMVMKKNKALVVFFYSKQCSFCSGFSYIFLTVARKLRFITNIMFARIDAEENILPWEYTMETYPTILLFPALKKSESRVFQSNVPITVSNLLGFLLTNIDPHLKIGAIWTICLQSKSKDGASCYFSLLRETLNQIDFSLRDWRRSNGRQKLKQLHKLKQLRQMYLLFAHHPHNYQLIKSYFEKFKVTFNFSDIHKLNVDRSIKDEL